MRAPWSRTSAGCGAPLRRGVCWSANCVGKDSQSGLFHGWGHHHARVTVESHIATALIAVLVLRDHQHIHGGFVETVLLRRRSCLPFASLLYGSVHNKSTLECKRHVGLDTASTRSCSTCRRWTLSVVCRPGTKVTARTQANKLPSTFMEPGKTPRRQQEATAEGGRHLAEEPPQKQKQRQRCCNVG